MCQLETELERKFHENHQNSIKLRFLEPVQSIFFVLFL